MKRFLLILFFFSPLYSSHDLMFPMDDVDDEELSIIYGDPISSYWGLHTIIDLENCSAISIRSYDIIKEYVMVLCDAIDMKRFGEPIIVHFGQEDRVAGYSLVQLIETSCITGHFANENNTAYIDVFSCKPYNPLLVKHLTQMAFGGKIKACHVIERGKEAAE